MSATMLGDNRTEQQLLWELFTECKISTLWTQLPWMNLKVCKQQKCKFDHLCSVVGGQNFGGVIRPSERLLQLYMHLPQVLYMFFQRLRSAEDSPHVDSILTHVRTHTHTHTCTHTYTHMHTHTRTALDSPSAQFPKHLLTPRQER